MLFTDGRFQFILVVHIYYFIYILIERGFTYPDTYQFNKKWSLIYSADLHVWAEKCDFHWVVEI